MKFSRSLTTESVCMLSAFNGLLVGLTVEFLRITYEKYKAEIYMEEALKKFGRAGYILNPMADPFIPVVCILTFAGVSHLVYRHFRQRPKSLILYWIVISIIALALRTSVEPLNYDYISFLYMLLFAIVSYLIYNLWINYPHSILPLWLVIGVTVVITVASVTQIIGLFIDQAYELRRIITWLLCLTLVLIFNMGLGVFVQYVFPRFIRLLKPTSSWLKNWDLS